MVTLQDEIEKVLGENFPGLNFDLERGEPRSLMGGNALMDRIDILEEHLDVRVDSIEGALTKVAEISRQSLMCLKTLQAPNYLYPHLMVVREHQSTSNTAGCGRKKRVLGKALFRSFFSRVATGGKKEMRLQFCALSTSARCLVAQADKAIVLGRLATG